MKENYEVPPYLHSGFSYKWLKVKLKMRLGVSGLGEDLHRQHRGNGLCPMCGQFETLKHFVFECHAYNDERDLMMKDILSDSNVQMFNSFIQDLDFAILCVLGDHDDNFNKYFINYLSAVWPKRCS